MKPLAAILLAVLFCGCMPVPSNRDVFPVAPKDRTDEIVSAIRAMPHPEPVDLSPIIQRLDAIERKGTLPARSVSEGYTGIKVFLSRTRGRCIPCDGLFDDLTAWVAGSNWTMGHTADSHFWMVASDDLEGLTPRYELWRNGELIDEWEGYTGDLQAIVQRHPAYPRSAKRSRRTSAVGTSILYGSGSSGDVLGAYGVSYTYPPRRTFLKVVDLAGGSGGDFGTYGVSYTLPSTGAVFSWGEASVGGQGFGSSRSYRMAPRRGVCIDGVCY